MHSIVAPARPEFHGGLLGLSLNSGILTAHLSVEPVESFRKCL